MRSAPGAKRPNRGKRDRLVRHVHLPHGVGVTTPALVDRDANWPARLPRVLAPAEPAGTTAVFGREAVVAAGTREHGKNFRAWDAIHLHEAAQWARTIGRPVVVATSDSDWVAADAGRPA